MKPSKEYFSEARPFNDQDDACLLDAIEQTVAMAAENDLENCGILITFVRDENGVKRVGVNRPGDDQFYGDDVREVLRAAFNAE